MVISYLHGKSLKLYFLAFHYTAILSLQTRIGVERIYGIFHNQLFDSDEQAVSFSHQCWNSRTIGARNRVVPARQPM
jgi:hypothetical protein